MSGVYSCRTETNQITVHSFDVLYPVTPVNDLIQHLMHTWEDIRELRNKNGINSQSYEYVYCAMIGQLVQAYDLLQSLISSDKQLISLDTLTYCNHILQSMLQDAHFLKEHSDTLLYMRLVKQLNKMMNIITI